MFISFNISKWHYPMWEQTPVYDYYPQLLLRLHLMGLQLNRSDQGTVWTANLSVTDTLRSHLVTNEYCWFPCAKTVPRGNNKLIHIVKEIITATIEVPTRTDLRFIVVPSRLKSFYISK